jgi:hypothetical protein
VQPGTRYGSPSILSTSGHAEVAAPHFVRRDFALVSRTGPRPLDQGDERRVGRQRDRLEVDVIQGQHHGRRRAMVGDDEWFSPDAQDIIHQRVGRLGEFDGLHRLTISPPISNSL